jgi:2-keto-3-deoxy-6-phosphogluconate aldolase
MGGTGWVPDAPRRGHADRSPGRLAGRGGGRQGLPRLRAPLPDVPLLPTGGVTVGHAPAYIEAGAVAVGIGSWLFGGGSPSSIIERGREAVGVVAAARASRQALRS